MSYQHLKGQAQVFRVGEGAAAAARALAALADDPVGRDPLQQLLLAKHRLASPECAAMDEDKLLSARSWPPRSA